MTRKEWIEANKWYLSLDNYMECPNCDEYISKKQMEKLLLLILQPFPDMYEEELVPWLEECRGDILVKG